ncbi:MAG: hypothetical protein WC490_00815 [Candidatus Margulisiibacteriota bacterium]
MDIRSYLNINDLDIRKTHDARFMDQKVTPDVLSIIADCAINVVGSDINKEFTVQDIWDSQYFNENVKAVFNKPSVKNPAAKHEYDKFIQQPLKALSYAGVLSCKRRGQKNYFKIVSPEILQYIAFKDRNAYVFLCDYIEKVLRDSGLMAYFENYKTICDVGDDYAAEYIRIKNRFERFIKGNTSIKKDFEPKRIFPKIFNIYAVENGLPGSEAGKASKHPFHYSDLMYNRINWRDVKKAKGISRQESKKISRQESEDILVSQNTGYDHYLTQKAVNIIKAKYLDSEIHDTWGNGQATQVHHIFPKNKFPELAHYTENLIKLTPSQHSNKAHKNGNYQYVDKDYQLICLLAKAETIEESLRAGEFIYSKESFVHVINKGLSLSLKYDMSFKEIKDVIRKIFR